MTVGLEVGKSVALVDARTGQSLGYVALDQAGNLFVNGRNFNQMITTLELLGKAAEDLVKAWTKGKTGV